MKLHRPSLSNRHGTLLKNTVMLYLLQFSNYILALAAVPYETRVLGTTVYGNLGTAMAVMVYFQLVIDFGFLLSATEEVSRSRADPRALRGIFTSVTLCKLSLAVISAASLLLLCQVIPAWQQKQDLLLLSFVSTVFASLMPDYLYRGLERMTAITVRTVLIRTFFTISIFFFLKRPEDVCVVPILNIIGNGCALAGAFLHIHRQMHLSFCRVSWREVWNAFRRSSTFFYSRIATTAYTAMNTVILDIVSAGGAVTGYYTSADKLITTGKNALTPISDSLYPYMVRNRDFKLIKKVLLITEPVIAVFCLCVFIWAEPLCALIFGVDFAPAGAVLRAMLPVGVIILPSYLLGFPTLTAMGLSKHANYSVILGSIVHVCNLLILFGTGHLNMVTLGCAVSLSEAAILLYRVLIIFKHRNLLRAAAVDSEKDVTS